VGWVEHVEVDRLVHNIYKLWVNSGLAFGAHWLDGMLDCQCVRLASVVMPTAFQSSDIGGNLYLVYDMHYRVPFSLYLIESPKNSDHYEKSFVAVVPSTEGRKSMLKLAEGMVMSYCSGVKHPMTQKQRVGNHGVSAITEIWYLIQTFSFCL